MRSKTMEAEYPLSEPPTATCHVRSHGWDAGWVVVGVWQSEMRHWLSSGLRLEGVYRKGGARARSLRLLADFRRDARSVKLRPGEHFVEDVTDTLKRFFRELDDPVTSARLLPRWREAAGTPKIPKHPSRASSGQPGTPPHPPRPIPEALLWDWAALSPLPSLEDRPGTWLRAWWKGGRGISWFSKYPSTLPSLIFSNPPFYPRAAPEKPAPGEIQRSDWLPASGQSSHTVHPYRASLSVSMGDPL